MQTLPAKVIEQAIVEAGWRKGSSLENKVAFHFMRWDRKEVVQQHGVGKYRLDFAWPEIQIGLEVDGWWHRSPEGAAKDSERDSWLRSEGWMVLRIDDRHGEDSMMSQLSRVIQVVNQLYVYKGITLGAWRRKRTKST
jgi:very-short-patch-repair endonuclease